MASVWILRRPTKDGSTRYRVMFRVGGREAANRYAGSFRTLREAELRLRWIDGELAAQRVPDVKALARTPAPTTIRTLAERWRASRLDVAPGTLQTYRVNLGRLLPRIGDVPADELTPDRVAALVVELTDDGLSRESTRKTLSTLAQVLDHAGIQPNPVRDPRVKLPRSERRHVSPPTAEHIEAVCRLLPTRYRLPLLVLDASGMRVGELEQLAWGDVDEPRERWRVSAASSKTGAPRWITHSPARALRGRLRAPAARRSHS